MNHTRQIEIPTTKYISTLVLRYSMSKEVALRVLLPEELKYRLDRTVLEEGTTIKNKVKKIFEEALPEYTQE